ncbi:MAG: OmpH family outer membrane protein [Muribaculaceae bacterium]|nr:OmpH family outer membrane protein [Muribaculaceae bacterium]
MIKKVLLAIALICPMLMSAQTLKIGLVDFATVLQAMPDYTAAMTQLKEVSDKYQAEFQKLQEEMNRQMTEFQNMPENELPAIKERKAREISDYDQKMHQFEQSASQDLNKMNNDLMGPITQKITQAVESVGREGNYSLIQMYDPQLVLYHAAPVEDITPAVKAKLGIN